jgi:hypothetical protein
MALARPHPDLPAADEMVVADADDGLGQKSGAPTPGSWIIRQHRPGSENTASA